VLGLDGLRSNTPPTLLVDGYLLRDPVPVRMMDIVDVAAFSQLLADLRPVLLTLDTQARVSSGALTISQGPRRYGWGTGASHSPMTGYTPR
jgi:hypothetical protein